MHKPTSVREIDWSQYYGRLGAVTNAQLAREMTAELGFNVSKWLVGYKCKQLGITPHKVDWTLYKALLLSDKTAAEVAAEITEDMGRPADDPVTACAVRERRRRMGQRRVVALVDYDHLPLGEGESDRSIAKRMKVSPSSLRAARKRRGKPPSTPSNKKGVDWSAVDLTRPSKELAAELGVSVRMVNSKKQRERTGKY